MYQGYVWLAKPAAAYKLIKELKNEVGLPIHLHTHDTSGNGVASILMAAQAGVDIVDTALNSMAGLTSQPALNSVVAAVQNTERESTINLDDIQKAIQLLAGCSSRICSVQSGSKAGTTEIYKY